MQKWMEGNFEGDRCIVGWSEYLESVMMNRGVSKEEAQEHASDRRGEWLWRHESDAAQKSSPTHDSLVVRRGGRGGGRARHQWCRGAMPWKLSPLPLVWNFFTDGLRTVCVWMYGDYCKDCLAICRPLFSLEKESVLCATSLWLWQTTYIMVIVTPNKLKKKIEFVFKC